MSYTMGQIAEKTVSPSHTLETMEYKFQYYKTALEELGGINHGLD